MKAAAVALAVIGLLIVASGLAGWAEGRGEETVTALMLIGTCVVGTAAWVAMGGRRG